MNIEQIARICHETNRAYCLELGDSSQQRWETAKQWQRDSAVKGVEFRLANPTAPASASHESWLAVKQADGWTYGPIKDEEKKQHPCFVPYDELPAVQKAKDAIFIGVVDALASLLPVVDFVDEANEPVAERVTVDPIGPTAEAPEGIAPSVAELAPAEPLDANPAPEAEAAKE